MNFSHFDAEGQAIMVDVSAKQPTLRSAIAEAKVQMREATLRLIRAGKAAKGDVLGVARLAGISAAKKTSDLIPLAHPLSIHAVGIEFEFNEQSPTIIVRGKVTAFERTGVEMEAMVAVSVAALTIYDMCKGVDRAIAIGEVSLLFKEGGKSGVYRREVRSDALSCHSYSQRPRFPRGTRRSQGPGSCDLVGGAKGGGRPNRHCFG